MNSERILLVIAVIAVGVSVIAAGVTYFSFSNLLGISGFAITGEANLTVETIALINFTTSAVEWGSGRVDNGATAASLNTFETNNVTGGNWTLTTAGGLRVENAGNVNVSLNLTGTKTAAAFIGGTGPVYKWNITNVEANSCLNASGSSVDRLDLDTFHDVNTSLASSMICPVFQPGTSNDLIRIDFNLTIPEDSTTGLLTDTITATAVADNPPIDI